MPRIKNLVLRHRIKKELLSNEKLTYRQILSRVGGSLSLINACMKELRESGEVSGPVGTGISTYSTVTPTIKEANRRCKELIGRLESATDMSQVADAFDLAVELQAYLERQEPEERRSHRRVSDCDVLDLIREYTKSDRPLTVQTIADTLGLKHPTANNRVKKLVAAGKVVHDGYKKIRLDNGNRV